MSKRRATVGHNSIDPALLKATVGHIMGLLDQRDGIDLDIKAYMTSAKEAGMKPAAIRRLVKELREDKSKRAEREAELEAYRAALGDFAATDLGRAGAPR